MANVYDKKFSIFQIILSVFFILVCVAVLVPILNIVATSLSGRDAIAMGKVKIFPVQITTAAYKMVFTDRTITRAMTDWNRPTAVAKS